MSWAVAGIADFNSDDRSDILWRRQSNGKHSLWLMSGTAIQPGSGTVEAVRDTQWTIAGSCD
ncbi:MAG: hypothetical protein ACYSU7_04815 [Planctomycetota bacterium]|jgi:hypothetical protein